MYMQPSTFRHKVSIEEVSREGFRIAHDLVNPTNPLSDFLQSRDFRRHVPLLLSTCFSADCLGSRPLFFDGKHVGTALGVCATRAPMIGTGVAI